MSIPGAVESLGILLKTSMGLGLARVVILDGPATVAGPCCALSVKATDCMSWELSDTFSCSPFPLLHL